MSIWSSTCDKLLKYKQKPFIKTLPRYQSTSLCSDVPQRCIGKPLAPPILIENACFSEDFHNDWAKTLKKFETKFQCKYNKYLPSIIKSLGFSVIKQRQENLE